MSVIQVCLGDLIEPANIRKAGSTDYPLLSMTMAGGLVDPATKFKKRVASEDTSGYKVVKRGQLVVGFPIDEGVLSFQQLHDEAIVSPAYGIWEIRSRASADPVYLEKFLKSPQAIAYYLGKLRSTTARRRSLDRGSFLALPVPLPPLEEQKRIAGILDQAAELCRLRTRALDKLDTLGQAIFHEMFGSDAAPVIAKGTQLIGDFCEVSSGSTPSRANSAFYDGDTLWVKTGEVNGSVIADTEEKISEEAIIAARLKIYPPETVLVAMYGQGKTRGRVGILGRPAATNQACAALLAGDRIHPRFLFHQLLVSYDRLRDQGRGGNQPNLNAGIIKDFPIYVPDILRQQKFVDKMQILEQRIARAYLHKECLFSFFSSLQHRAFRGEM